MSPVLFALPGNERIGEALKSYAALEMGHVEFRRFPDEESYVRLLTPVRERAAVLVCTLDRPDSKILPLLLAAQAARELGARQIGLVAPYLAYMRQDKRFQPGEAVSSRLFAGILSRAVDWLVTVDPHLHRIGSLADIYDIPAHAVHAAPLISRWIRGNISSPLLIGPDEESKQWVGAVASGAGAPHLVLQKVRRGDRDVEITMPDISPWRGATPVLIDDIISSARTMIEALGHLRRANMRPAVCIGVHGVFVPGAYEALRAAGPSRIVTSNTIAHETNAIDAAPLLAQAMAGLLP